MLREQCSDLLVWTRRRLKMNRQNGYLFSPLQVQAILVRSARNRSRAREAKSCACAGQTTTVAAGFACHIAWIVARWLVKKGLSRVQDLVIDFHRDGAVELATSQHERKKVK